MTQYVQYDLNMSINRQCMCIYIYVLIYLLNIYLYTLLLFIYIIIYYAICFIQCSSILARPFHTAHFAHNRSRQGRRWGAQSITVSPKDKMLQFQLPEFYGLCCVNMVCQYCVFLDVYGCLWCVIFIYICVYIHTMYMHIYICIHKP